jgi:hypothetical protein
VTSQQFASIDLSASTRGGLTEGISLHSSGATTALSESESAAASAHVVAPRYRRSLGSILCSAMLPLVAVDDYVFQRRRLAETASAYVYFIGEWDLDLIETPTVAAVWPQRQTLRFGTNRPVRRLSKRTPFIPPSAVFTE